MTERWYHIPPEEDQKLFSKYRAIRGAKIGAAWGLGSPSIATCLTLLQQNSNSELINSLPTISLIFLEHGAPWTAIGSIIDSFQPTSKIIERHVKFLTEPFKVLRKP